MRTALGVVALLAAMFGTAVGHRTRVVADPRPRRAGRRGQPDPPGPDRPGTGDRGRPRRGRGPRRPGHLGPGSTAGAPARPGPGAHPARPRPAPLHLDLTRGRAPRPDIPRRSHVHPFPARAPARRPTAAAACSSPTSSSRSCPASGRRYELHAAEGGDVVVVIHHSGRRDLYVLDPRGRTAASVTLTDAQARTPRRHPRRRLVQAGGGRGDGGRHRRPPDRLGHRARGRARRRPHDRRAGDPPPHPHERRRDPARRRDAVIAPEPTEQLLAGDQLVVVGRQEDLPGFLRHVIGELGGG